jgi:hypothetical protein
MKMKKTFRKPAWAVLGLVLAFAACENPAADSDNTGDPVDIVTPTTNEEHLAMLKNLGVNINPGLPLAPNEQTYNPQASSGLSLGPLGKIFSRPKREIFLAGYNLGNGKHHALYEDFDNLSSLTLLGQDSKNDSGWADGTGPLLPRNSVAADLNGDGIDEVVIVTLMGATDRILVNKGEYKNRAFTVTQMREFAAPESVSQTLYNNNLRLAYWNIIAADLNGDNKRVLGLEHSCIPVPGGLYGYPL